MACDAFVKPLDLECIFVNFLAGDWVIFGLLAIFFIVGLAGTFRMSNLLTGTSLFLFGIIFYDQLPWIFYVSLVFGGIVMWGIVASFFKR